MSYLIFFHPNGTAILYQNRKKQIFTKQPKSLKIVGVSTYLDIQPTLTKWRTS